MARAGQGLVRLTGPGGLARHGVEVVGPIPARLASPAIPRLRDVRELLLPAFSVFIVAFSCIR